LKYFLILLISISSLFAQSLSTRYDVDVSLFGNVGYADITLKEDDKNYEIKLVATTVGVAATLLQNRVETFTSKGKIIGGRYIPDIFIKTKETIKKTRVQTYYFDHEKKEIKLIEEKTKLVNEMSFDPATFKVTSKEVEKKSKKETTLDKYKENDVLSSYLNTKNNCNAKQKTYKLFAVGAHNDKNDVLVSYLEDLERESAVANFSEGIANIYNLHVAPLDKDESVVDVLVAFDNDGFLKEALLGEIFWVGKITAKRVYHKVACN
jgi:hypothetical protein